MRETIIRDHGEVFLLKDWLNKNEAALLYRELIENLNWSQDVAYIAGRKVNLPRLTFWSGQAGLVYKYSGITNISRGWHPALKELAERISHETGEVFNSVLCNYYRTGKDYIGWHSDNERELGDNPMIATVSLGESRRFLLKNKESGVKKEALLEEGSLLLMQGELQKNWLHSIAKTEKNIQGRISLTFRKILRS